MNSYQATLKKTGFQDSKFDMLKNNISEAALVAEKIGKENNCDSVEVKNNQLHKGTEDYILKTKLK
ncbi:MAG: hypothetical protein M0P71_16845 [Melioribacteraceae bacterium]|jgi:hypothetical protein|nr:hypothetical protein [Melioribacteraceae bacterium]